MDEHNPQTDLKRAQVVDINQYREKLRKRQSSTDPVKAVGCDTLAELQQHRTLSSDAQLAFQANSAIAFWFENMQIEVSEQVRTGYIPRQLIRGEYDPDFHLPWSFDLATLKEAARILQTQGWTILPLWRLWNFYFFSYRQLLGITLEQKPLDQSPADQEDNQVWLVKLPRDSLVR